MSSYLLLQHIYIPKTRFSHYEPNVLSHFRLKKANIIFAVRSYRETMKANRILMSLNIQNKSKPLIIFLSTRINTFSNSYTDILSQVCNSRCFCIERIINASAHEQYHQCLFNLKYQIRKSEY